jgi:membrane-bound serine protease (ClpP class)
MKRAQVNQKLKALAAIVFIAGAFFVFGQTQENTEAEKTSVLLIRLENEAITPVTVRFVARAVREAEARNAECLIIVLDTPGGLVESTRELVKTILHSRVPVVVYVAPTGARAASAGVFITMAGHVAAMTPGTNIGAAHPVQIGGLPGSEPPQPAAEKRGETETKRATTPMEDKILNDTIAWARSLAELRGRNADWAERAVRESISATASDAAREGAIDLIAGDINDLLSKIDGREVQLLDRRAKLQTANAEIINLEMWWGERVLSVLANPTLAFLLLLLGFYGILFEFYTPGWGVSGTLGAIFLVLGFFAMAILPVNYVGLALIVIALAMFAAEAFVVSYGLLTVSGAVCLVLGGIMLVESPAGFMQVPYWLLIPVSLAASIISFFLVGSIVKTHHQTPQTGTELTKETAVALEKFHSKSGIFHGQVRAHGEIWRATSGTPVAKNEILRIEDREGLTLRVSPVRFQEEEGEEKDDY